MKIRRYKGPNREELYKTILQEMGPNAVVVAGAGGETRFGRTTHELIAILDEAAEGSAPAGRLPVPGEPEEWRRLRRQHMQQWRDMQKALASINADLKHLKNGQGGAGAEDASLPVHARRWDPRFCAWARANLPALVEADEARARKEWARHLPVASDFLFRHPERQPHIVVLAGPTGSGKTTTLAKLATISAMQNKLKVGLITTDTYRIAAVDQIREYASLLDADLRVVFSASEARAAVSAMASNDVIFVDTPGRTHFDEMGLASIQNVLRGMGAVTVMLTVPATMNRADLSDMFEGFSRFQPDYLVVTKVDETRRPDIFTSLPFESDRRVAFVTDGQRVPQDIFAARSDRIADLLFQPERPAETLSAETSEALV
ncbi:MAG: hypothetical protein GX548_08730 [Lentisphaerae bacterium]|nr:hypothetical protein [Lentisphaerota bacterium]